MTKKFPTAEDCVMEMFAEACQKQARKKRQNPLTKKIEETANLISTPVDYEIEIESKPFVFHISEDTIIVLAVIGFFALIIFLLLIFGS